MGQSPDISEMYRAPGVDVDWVQKGAPQGSLPAFYVVSPAKFIILFVCTMGIYQVYWFYAHFRRIKLTHRDDTWPAVRAVFAVFFTHGLFRHINAQGGNFNADSHATTYVVLTIAARVVDRIAQASETLGGLDLLGIVLGMSTLFPLYTAQKAANHACGDPAGDQNSRLSLGNWAWCGLGALVWLLIVAGMLVETAL